MAIFLRLSLVSERIGEFLIKGSFRNANSTFQYGGFSFPPSP
jgi:hypothetical protein